MNGICGLVSFCGNNTLSLQRSKMEVFLNNTITHIEYKDILSLSVCTNNYCELISDNSHILCIILNESSNIMLTEDKMANTVAQLYVKYGKQFTSFLKNSCSVIIYDFHKKQFFIFQNKIGNIPIFYSCNNGIFAFSTDINSLFEIPYNKKTFSPLSLNKLFGLYPSMKSGETIYDNIFFIPPGYCAVLHNKNILINEPETASSKFKKIALDHYRKSVHCNPYYIADITLSPAYALNPYVLESARKRKKFTNKMLLDIIFPNNFSFSFNTPFFIYIDRKRILKLLKTDIQEQFICDNYTFECLYDEISDMPPFKFSNEPDIECQEIIFLNRKMLFPQITCNLFSFLRSYNIKNESILNDPDAINYIFSIFKHKNIKDALSEIFSENISIFKPYVFPDVFRSDLKKMCLHPNLKIFRILDRFKLYDMLSEIDARLSLYILQINYLLEHKNITLEF